MEGKVKDQVEDVEEIEEGKRKATRISGLGNRSGRERM